MFLAILLLNCDIAKDRYGKFVKFCGKVGLTGGC